jgi:hypothetical protein
MNNSEQQGVRGIPLKGKLRIEERNLALSKAKEIGAISESLYASKITQLKTEDGQTIWVSKGHGGYDGAEWIIDVFNGDPQVDDNVERPASYGFYPDRVICVEDYFTRRIDQMPAHEANEGELIVLLTQLQAIAVAKNI